MRAPVSPLRWLSLWLCSVLLLVLTGCERRMPPLVEVLEVGPSTLERHERIEVRGQGFPPGRSAQVVFRGQLHAPGERPSATELVTEGRVSADDRLVVEFDEVLESRFAARAGRLRHVTFHGVVEVRFERNGGGEVFGVLEQVQLDVRPSAAEADDEQGALALQRLGATGAESEEGVVLGELSADGVLVQHGLRSGDRLVEFGGVRVERLGDLFTDNVPRPLTLRFLREGDGQEHALSIEEPPFERGVPSWLLLLAIGFFSVAVTFGLLASSRLTLLRRWELALRSMLRVRPAHTGQAGAKSRWLSAHRLSHAALLLLAVGATLVPLHPRLRELDLPTVLLAWIVARLVVAWPGQSARVRGTKQVLAWLGSTLMGLVPMCALVGLSVWQTAALRLVDVASSQGPWLVLESPWLSLTLLGAVASEISLAKALSPRSALASGLGCVLLVVIGGGGYPAAAPLLQGLIFLSKFVIAVALLRSLGELRRRALGTRRSRPALWPFALSLLAPLLDRTLGTPVLVSEWFGPMACVWLALLALVILTRAWAIAESVDDALEPA